MKQAHGQGRKWPPSRNTLDHHAFDHRRVLRSALPGALRILYRGIEEFGVGRDGITLRNRDDRANTMVGTLAVIVNSADVQGWSIAPLSAGRYDTLSSSVEWYCVSVV